MTFSKPSVYFGLFLISLLFCTSECVLVWSAIAEREDQSQKHQEMAFLMLSALQEESQFAFSCLGWSPSGNVSGTCTNVYSAASVSDCPYGIRSAEACAAGSLGVCRQKIGGQLWWEVVFYSGNSLCSDTAACEDYCLNILGGENVFTAY
jgi:hypothetical protein